MLVYILFIIYDFIYHITRISTHTIFTDQKYWHIWNEPNAVFRHHDKTGEDYAQFYFQVAKVVKSKYPQVELSGPATWCPPVHKS